MASFIRFLPAKTVNSPDYLLKRSGTYQESRRRRQSSKTLRFCRVGCVIGQCDEKAVDFALGQSLRPQVRQGVTQIRRVALDEFLYVRERKLQSSTFPRLNRVKILRTITFLFGVITLRSLCVQKITLSCRFFKKQKLFIKTRRICVCTYV